MKNYSNRDTNKYRRWKAVIAVLLAFVVAMTTYDFMVPTFALTDDTSQAQTVQNAESDVDSDSDAPEAAEEPAVETDEDGIGTDEDINAADADSDADFNAKATETTLRVKDKTYTVEVTYGEEAGVSDEAELTVEEIDKSMNEFDEYMARTEEAVGEDLAVDFARFFDIKIMNGEEEVQPADTVKVRIELTDKLKKKDVTAIHFIDEEDAAKDAEDEENVVLDADVTKAETKKMESAVSFETDGFSVYAIAETTPLETASNLSELESGGFYISIDNSEGRYYAKNSINTASNKNYLAKTNVADIDSAALYYFEKVSGTQNQFYIYYKDNEANPVYVNMADNGNYSFSSETKTPFVVEDHKEQGTFYIYKLVNNKKYTWYYNTNGFFGTVKGLEDNNKIVLTKAIGGEKDPYGIDGTSYGILNNYDSVTGTAMMNTASGSKLTGKKLTVKTDTISRTGNVFVAENSEITMWFFEYQSEDKYRISTVVGGAKKYLSITSSGIALVSEPDDNCLIAVESGTGKYTGKYKFSSNGYALCLNSNNFEQIADLTTSAKKDGAWMNLAEKSNLNDDDFVPYTATKVSVSGKVNEDGTIDYDVKNGDQIVIYTRIWNDDTKRYDYYIVDYDGVLVKGYASGDTISWVGTKVNTMLWNFTEYYYAGTTTPNYYYELENDYTGKYLAPQISNGAPLLHDNTVGINLNGRRNMQYYTTVLAWDNGYYDYASLKTNEGKVISAPISKADTFYFAVMTPHEEEDHLTTVETLDHTPYGIKLTMQNYHDPVYSPDYRSKTQTEVIGDPTFNAWTGKQGLLTRNIDPETGYPTSTETKESLSKLFNNAMEVNQQFLTSTYSETGYFEYDSTQNFAHLIWQDDDKWIGKPRPGGGTYKKGDFVIYDQLGTTNEGNKDTLKHGQFFPYNDIAFKVDEEGNVTEAIPVSTKYKNDMDIHAQPLSSLDPRKGEALYSLPFEKGKTAADVNAQGYAFVDHFFGMEMQANFMQSASGLDDWGHDLIFEFSGDDDFWFYVDDMLVLDLGGVHSALDGSINFRTGKVIVNGTPADLKTLYKAAYLEKHEGASEDEVNEFLNYYFNSDGVFKDYSGHTLRMFYMERGAGASNIHMRFNLAPYTPGEVQLEKEVSGIETIDPGMKFPYQIYVEDKDTPDHPDAGSNVYKTLSDSSKVTDTKTGEEIPYQETYTVDGLTYENVFFLKPGQIASILLDSEDTKYYIRECGTDTDTYDEVKINNTPCTGKATTVENRWDYETEPKNVAACKKVIYNNHVSSSAQKNLLITKKLWEDFEKNRLMKNDPTGFRLRIYIGKDGDGEYTVYNTGTYYVKNPEGYYCIHQGGSFVSTGKQNYDELRKDVLPGEWESEQEMATFATSPSGAVDMIPAGYTVEVPGLMAGTAFKVIEREDEIPAGYNLIDYELQGGDPDGDEGNAGTIKSSDDSVKVTVNNQHGYGLTVQKNWSDAAFMNYHNEIYFAVYDKESGEYIDGTLRQLGKTDTTIRWFFPELAEGKTLNDYHVYEVVLKNEDEEIASYEECEDAVRKDPDTGAVILPDEWSFEKVAEGGTITVGGETNEHGYSTTYDYTTSYDREVLTQQQIADKVNSRKDKVSNARPGLKLVKTDMSGQLPDGALEGGTFKLVNADGTVEKTFTSDEDGLIMVAYLTAGEEYTLTETGAPYKYLSLIDPLTIKVDAANHVYVNGEDTSGDYYLIQQVKNPTAANMPTITIKNKPFTLKAEKVDAVNGNPVSGAVFELYREVKEAGTNYPRPDYVPMDGFENLVTEEDGTIPDINMDKLTPRTYYLREKRNPALYMSIDYDIRLIIRKTGQIEIQKAEFSEAEGRYVFSEITDNSAKLVTDKSGNVTLVVRDEPAKVVKILKKAKMEYGEDPVLGGAEFKLYKASQIDAETGKPKEGEKPLIEGKTGQNGILNLGALNDNAEYYLYETKAPKGYEATDTPIIIKVKKNGTVQRKTGENEYEDVPTVKEGDVEVATIEVYNLARFKLQLTKSLPVYVDNGEGNNTAIVFELNGYAVDEATGKEVVKYHKTVGIEFTKDGPREQTITVENIPGGLSRLMVKEAFGGNFKPKDAAEQQASGPDEKGVYTVSFENELNNKTHGSGVVNKYEQDEDGQFHHIKPQE